MLKFKRLKRLKNYKSNNNVMSFWHEPHELRNNVKNSKGVGSSRG